MRMQFYLTMVCSLTLAARGGTGTEVSTDPAARQGIEQQLRETEDALKANDAGRAVDFVEQAYRSARESLEPRDPLRGKVLQLYTVAKLVHARAGNEWMAGEVADLLVEVAKAYAPHEEVHQQIQSIAVDYRGGLLLKKAQEEASSQNGNIEQAHRRLRADTDALRETFQQAGVDPAVAKLVAFPLAKFQQDHKLLRELQSTLSMLETVIEDDSVSPFFRRHFYNQMGLLQTELQNLATARDYSHRARKLAEEANDGATWALSQINLGYLALLRGDYRDAQILLEEVHAQRNVLGQILAPVDQANLLMNLAKVMEWSSDYHAAASMINEALELITSQGQKNAGAESLCLNNRAINAYSRGKFEDARSDLAKARQLAEEHFGENHLRVAEVEANLGWVDLAFDNVTEAERHFRTATNIVGEQYGDDHPRMAEMLSYQSRALFQLDRLDEAREVLLRALDLQEERLERVLRSSITERDRLAFVQNLRVHAESPTWPGVFDTYLELAPRLGISSGDQYAHVLAWKGIVTDYRLPPPHRLQDDPQIRELVLRRKEVLQQLRAANVEELGGSERARITRQLELQANQLELQLRNRSPRLTASFQRAPIEPPQIQSSLDKAAALLDMVQVRRYQVRESDEVVRESTEYIGFLLRPAGAPLRIDFGPAQPINDAIRILLQQLPFSTAARGFQVERDPSLDRSYQDVAGELQQRVVERLAPHLEEVRLLVTASDGAFHRIPLGLLPGAKEDFWVQEMAFARTPDAQTFVRRREVADGDGGLLAVGGVEFGDQWQPLTGTDKEVDEIKALFEQSFPSEAVQLLKGREASKQRLLALLPQSRYIHFATHGSFADRQTESNFDIPGLVAQLDSRLVLSAPAEGRPGDDQYLTAEELGGLPLERAELVVLSACDTGLGYVSAGQTVIGMIGALDQAGAKAILGSLWKVDDAATVELMKSFYHQLWVHQRGPAEALRAAQLQLIGGESSAKYRHPKYWAAFVIAGQPGAASNEQP